MQKKCWKGKKVLVTGYEGFLGSHLTQRLLSCQAKVVGIDILTGRKNTILSRKERKAMTIIRGDIANRKNLEKVINRHKCEFVFHLAAEAIVGKCMKDPLRTFSSNIQGTWNVLEVCRHVPSVKAIVIAIRRAYILTLRFTFRCPPFRDRSP